MHTPERFIAPRLGLAAAALAVGGLSLHASENQPSLESTNVTAEGLPSAAVPLGALSAQECVTVRCLQDELPPKPRPLIAEQSKPRSVPARASRSRSHGTNRTASHLQLAGYPSAADFDRLAACESTSNWHINSGNGFYGGIQFDRQTWAANGGLRYAPRADMASREEQIAIGQATFHSTLNGKAERRWTPWPACSRKLGLR